MGDYNKYREFLKRSYELSETRCMNEKIKENIQEDWNVFSSGE